MSELRARERRSALGIVAPRSAARRAIGESAGPEGMSLATSRPRSVTTKLSPALTSRRYRERSRINRSTRCVGIPTGHHSRLEVVEKSEELLGLPAIAPALIAMTGQNAGLGEMIEPIDGCDS